MNGFRAEIAAPTETVGLRIRNAQGEKIPYMLILGDKEIQAGKVAVRSRQAGDQGQLGVTEFLEKLKKETHRA